MLRKIAVSAIALAMTGGATISTASAEEIVIRFSHVVPEAGHPKGEAAAASGST